MLVPAFLAVVSLQAQLTAPIPNESRSPMSIRPAATDACRLSISGSTRVGKTTVSGGSIEVRDLTGRGFHAVGGVLRFIFPNGRYEDQTWRYLTLGHPVSSTKVVPTEAKFEGGLTMPTRIEGRVLGAYLGNGEVCGETGSAVRDRYERSLESSQKDAAEAIEKANHMPARQFAEAVRSGLLKGGPYARETSDASNAMMKSNLLTSKGELIGGYKDWLKHWQEALKPARRSHPTQSSQPHGQ